METAITFELPGSFTGVEPYFVTRGKRQHLENSLFIHELEGWPRFDWTVNLGGFSSGQVHYLGQLGQLGASR